MLGELLGAWRRKQTGLKIEVIRLQAGRVFWESSTGSGSVDWMIFNEVYEREEG